MNCQSLYLNPRPTRATIGLAYADYYTHRITGVRAFLREVKTRLINECLSQRLARNISPHLYLPRIMSGLVAWIGRRVGDRFGWEILVNRPRGTFVDVGCGDGAVVAVAGQLGWDAMGIEVDPAAVRGALKKGLHVVEGSYERLAMYVQHFDFVMCSHVLEHVHDPRDLLKKLRLVIKPGGVLVLSSPNSLSALRHHFGANWRGLEAPRHIAIPAESELIRLLVECGFSVCSSADNKLETAVESFRIKRRGRVVRAQDVRMAQQLNIDLRVNLGENDFIKLICYVS